MRSRHTRLCARDMGGTLLSQLVTAQSPLLRAIIRPLECGEYTSDLE